MDIFSIAICFLMESNACMQTFCTYVLLSNSSRISFNSIEEFVWKNLAKNVPLRFYSRYMVGNFDVKYNGKTLYWYFDVKYNGKTLYWYFDVKYNGKTLYWYFDVKYSGKDTILIFWRQIQRGRQYETSIPVKDGYVTLRTISGLRNILSR